jgi:hypothetical protein
MNASPVFWNTKLHWYLWKSVIQAFPLKTFKLFLSDCFIFLLYTDIGQPMKRPFFGEESHKKFDHDFVFLLYTENDEMRVNGLYSSSVY